MSSRHGSFVRIVVRVATIIIALCIAGCSASSGANQSSPPAPEKSLGPPIVIVMGGKPAPKPTEAGPSSKGCSPAGSEDADSVAARAGDQWQAWASGKSDATLRKLEARVGLKAGSTRYVKPSMRDSVGDATCVYLAVAKVGTQCVALFNLWGMKEVKPNRLSVNLLNRYHRIHGSFGTDQNDSLKNLGNFIRSHAKDCTPPKKK